MISVSTKSIFLHHFLQYKIVLGSSSTAVRGAPLQVHQQRAAKPLLLLEPLLVFILPQFLLVFFLVERGVEDSDIS